MALFKRILRIALFSFLGTMVISSLIGGGTYFYLNPRLPSIEVLKDVKLQIPLRIYSIDDALIGEFGKKRRIPARYHEIPRKLQEAFLAAEDDRFFIHPGVDYQGILRAVYTLILTGEKRQGGSTITMQVARNFFLSREKTYLRKINEILLALKIESKLTKQEILELYLNKIYLGNRAYGVGAAAQIYYGKRLKDLTLAEMTMIAGLPKAPSRYNPIINPKRALQRRNYVLRRMRLLNYIDSEAAELALHQPITAQLHNQTVGVDAQYIAELVRAQMIDRYGEEAYSAGYRVITSINSRLQVAANRAIREGLHNYDKRSGYRAHLGQETLPPILSHESLRELLHSYASTKELTPAIVVAVNEVEVDLYTKQGEYIFIEEKGIVFPKKGSKASKQQEQSVSDLLQAGDVLYVRRQINGEWEMAQQPEVEGALVSISPDDGAILAMVGGYDFARSKFNRVTQGVRQPGSNFKPIIYSAALEKDFTAATLVNDAPVVFDDPGLGSTWRPENYSGRFFGPTRLRRALIKSRNLVSIRLLNQIGVGYAIRYAERFGMDPQKLPHDLSLALGSASVTPLELARAYAVFANGGYLIDPYYIVRIEDREGRVLYQAEPAVACSECESEDNDVAALSLTQDVEGADSVMDIVALEDRRRPQKLAPRTVDKRNVYLMTTIMQDVVKRGTGRKALVLKRKDLAGKTGTTNEQRDAWFSGFNRRVVTTSWVGFDDSHTLGERETGGRAALPIWVDYMREALKGMPESSMEQPAGFVMARIDKDSGLLTSARNKNAIFELFRSENLARMDHHPEPQQGIQIERASGEAELPEQQLF